MYLLNTNKEEQKKNERERDTYNLLFKYNASNVHL